MAVNGRMDVVRLDVLLYQLGSFATPDGSTPPLSEVNRRFLAPAAIRAIRKLASVPFNDYGKVRETAEKYHIPRSSLSSLVSRSRRGYEARHWKEIR